MARQRWLGFPGTTVITSSTIGSIFRPALLHVCIGPVTEYKVIQCLVYRKGAHSHFIVNKVDFSHDAHEGLGTLNVFIDTIVASIAGMNFFLRGPWGII